MEPLTITINQPVSHVSVVNCSVRVGSIMPWPLIIPIHMNIETRRHMTANQLPRGLPSSDMIILQMNIHFKLDKMVGIGDTLNRCMGNKQNYSTQHHKFIFYFVLKRLPTSIIILSIVSISWTITLYCIVLFYCKVT